MSWRSAGPDEARALRDLERVANLASLGHVFPREQYPYPDQAVLERWQRTIADPGVTVDVVPGANGDSLVAFAAYDATTLRHLALHPEAWGRGLAREAVDRAVAALCAAGQPRALLWCLRENRRARGFYEHLGWRATGAARTAEWVPHPEELEYALDLHAATCRVGA